MEDPKEHKPNYWRALWFAVCLVIYAPSSAQSTTGNVAYEACTATDDVRYGFCAGYAIGVWEGIKYGAANVLIQTDPANSAELEKLVNAYLGVCVPLEVNNRQIVDVFKLYLASHPAARHQVARFAMLTALRDAFPCP